MPAFDFARQLRDSDFRRRLTMTGYFSGMPVVALAAGQDWSAGLALLPDRSEPALLARQNIDHLHGWELHYVRQGAQ